MHILDEAKKQWVDVCPRCEREVKADQLTLINYHKALLHFRCGCGYKHMKVIEVDLAVDLIE